MTGAGRWPSVSVVIPTLGARGLLQQAVASVTAQEYDGPVECLVVLDDADAPLPDVEMDSANRSVRCLRNARVPGPSGGRNTGVLAAEGEMIAFLDDDDAWRPEKLRLQVELLQRLDARVAGSSITIRSDSSTRDRIFPSPSLTADHLRRGRQQAVHQSTMVTGRDHMLNNVGLFDEQIPFSYGEDLDWLLRATAIEPVVIVQSPQVDVRWHLASFFATRWEAIAEAVPYLLDKHPSLSSDRRYHAALLGRVAFAQAALGQRRQALRWALAAARSWPIEPRIALTAAACVSRGAGPVVFRAVRRSGRSI
jgi:glycosyltransferase involved in cell wall biosynthesis